MEHSEQVGINAPPHDGVCFDFELMLKTIHNKMIFMQKSSVTCIGSPNQWLVLFSLFFLYFNIWSLYSTSLFRLGACWSGKS